ncbi:Pycsar system effector family protein [Curtobacterium sp. VKM Ac-2887]|uniref:Pycsar system effector family protein n=1 Tax=Curtobacterium sp. VKM Ac-2887 TaxID=2783819 RepID=UPI003A5C3C8A
MERKDLEQAASLPNPEHAWKTLLLTNDWIRHADAKAGVTLAFTGALGTILFNLVKESAPRSVAFDVIVVLASSLLVLTAGLCGWTLTPRATDRDSDPTMISRIFFGSISKNFDGDRRRYAEALEVLTADQRELVREIAHQVHVNARIATVKMKFATFAIRSALAASACLAIVVIMVGISTF